MSVIIKIDTGFVGAIHEHDTDTTVDEWKALPDKEKQDWITQLVWESIEAYAVDEETDEIIE